MEKLFILLYHINMKKPELLAPAGDADTLKAAVSNGADAVYFGAGGFNARDKASSLSDTDFLESVKIARAFGVKTYVTLNTLIYDEEYGLFLDTAYRALQNGADALIVQDAGAARLLKENFPDAVLHLSTQAGVNNAYGASYAASAGFKRVVLARETKLADIIRIKNETDIELEYFIHGALCVSYSGNCYLSALKTGKSGNRGKCLQLCRLPFGARCENNYGEGFYLSARDLCLVERIKELNNAGVVSFKIEGRLRRQAYVAEAVKTYRNAIDAVCAGKSFDYKKAERELAKVFVRGDFNRNAYLDNEMPQNVINPFFNNHTGEKGGCVLSVKPFKNIYKVTLKSDLDIHAGDGLKFFDKNKEVASVGIGNLKKLSADVYEIYTSRKLYPELSFSRITDKNKQDAVKDVADKLKIPVSYKITARSGEKFVVSGTAGDKTAYAESTYLLEKAKTAPITAEDIRFSFSRTDYEIFKTEKTDIVTDGVFIAKSNLNGFRREVNQKLYEAVSAVRDVQKASALSVSDKSFLKRDIYAFSDAHSISAAESYIKTSNAILIIKPSIYTEKYVTDMYVAALKAVPKEDVGIYIPANACGNEIDYILKLAGDKIKTLYCDNVGGVSLSKKGYRIIAGALLNVVNNKSAEEFLTNGAECIVSGIENKGTLNCAVKYLYGRIPLMTYSHCPYKTVIKTACAECKHKDNLNYILNGENLLIKRRKVLHCAFELVSDNVYNKVDKERGYFDFSYVKTEDMINILKERINA